MTTVIIDTRTTEAKKMLDYLKSTNFAQVIDERKPNAETIKAMKEVEKGKVTTHKSAKDMMATLKKKAGV